jgi:hypothetical protein
MAAECKMADIFHFALNQSNIALVFRENTLNFHDFSKWQFFFISLSMPLTGLSLEMHIFHSEANSLSTHISGSKRPIFTYLGSLESPWPVDGS